VGNVVSFRRAPTRQGRFEKVVEPHFEALYGAARRMTLSYHDAEDLVQEVCIKAFAHLDRLETMKYPRSWLVKVMYNLFLDDKRREERSSIDAAAKGQDSGEPETLDSGEAPLDELIDRTQNIERVLNAMRCLDPDQCALVAMHDVEGVSVAELCAMTGLPAGTIKSQLHRTRRKLGRLLSNDAIRRSHLKIVGTRR
jgi:RNA polymerase sigma-70 factor (ECF subfamily)